MFFNMPVKLYSERNCVKNHAAEWTTLGCRALIVTGKSSAANGALQDVESVLQEKQIAFCVYDEIEENPSIETVMKVRAIGSEQGSDFVIGIGGGSPMDAAKAAALLLAQPDKTEDFLYTSGSDQSLPLVEIPTTCGTGAEVTPNAVLTIHKKRTKASISHRIFAHYALLDGKYLEHAPRQLIINTAVDALGHLMESYINCKATTYSRMLSVYGMEQWALCKPVLIGGKATLADYDHLLDVSAIAGMSIAHTGTTLPHALSYYLTFEKGIPHGKAVGYFLPGYLERTDPMERKKILQILGFPDFQYFCSFIHQLIGGLEAEKDLIDRTIAGTLEQTAKIAITPYPVTEETLYRFFSL